MLAFLSIAFLIGVFSERPPPPWNSPPFNGKLTHSPRMKRSSQCYGDLGCFSNAFPFNNTGEALPLNPRFIRTRFLLFSSINERFPTRLERNDVEQLRRSRYNGNLPTKVIIHGFQQYGMVNWTKQMSREFILKEPTNVVIVDWGHGSGWPYTQAAANTRVVGAEVAKLIEFLVAEGKANIANFHLIGHSLGAHVAGYAGEALTGLGRITGLDPAEPNFKHTDTRARLDPGDANFVDVIHTDGSTFNEISGYGLLDPVGHIDFYPNGGENQPGCPRENWVNIFSQSYHSGVAMAENLITCSHSRSIALFTESITNDCRFTAYPCQSFEQFVRGECLSCGDYPCPIMGLYANKYETSTSKPRGKFYLATGKSSPYCRVTYGIAVHLSAGMQSAEGLLELAFVGSNGKTANHTVYSTHFVAGQIYKDILMSPEHISNFSRVTLTFIENSQIWSWIWTGVITIDKVTVTDGQTRKTKYYCGRNIVIHSGSSVTLTTLSAVC